MAHSWQVRIVQYEGCEVTVSSTNELLLGIVESPQNSGTQDIPCMSSLHPTRQDILSPMQ
jgi:hypothetical protein